MKLLTCGRLVEASVNLSDWQDDGRHIQEVPASRVVVVFVVRRKASDGRSDGRYAIAAVNFVSRGVQ